MDNAVPDIREDARGAAAGGDWAALLDRPFDLLLALEARVRATKLDVAAGQTQSWTGLAFRLRDLWLLAPREDVREVIVPPRLTRVPGAKPWMLGVANVRGSLLPVTDLGSLLGWPPSTERLPAGLLVDEVAGYRSFAPADQHPDSVDDVPALKPYLLGAFLREGRRWRVLSLHRLTRDPAFAQAGL